MYRMRRGLGEPPQDDCPSGMSLFGNPPTCVTNAIAGQAAANLEAATQGTCPPGFALVGTGPQFCSPLGAGGGSPCDFGNVFLNGSCYPAGSTQSGGVITQPDGTKIDSATGMVIGSYDWTVSHGGGGAVSPGPSATPPPATVSSPPPADPAPAIVSSAPPPVSSPAIVSSAPPGSTTQVQTGSGFSFSSIPWWGWAGAAAVALLAFNSK